jgi:hypothetical protein
MENYIPPYPVFPSESRMDGDLYKIFRDNGLNQGRMISGSKSFYKENHPENLVVFNANIATKSRGKVWYGDLDVTLDYENLEKIAEILKEDLFILYEMDGRFENENAGFPYWEQKAKAKIEYHEA